MLLQIAGKHYECLYFKLEMVTFNGPCDFSFSSLLETGCWARWISRLIYQDFTYAVMNFESSHTLRNTFYTISNKQIMLRKTQSVQYPAAHTHIYRHTMQRLNSMCPLCNLAIRESTKSSVPDCLSFYHHSYRIKPAEDDAARRDDKRSHFCWCVPWLLLMQPSEQGACSYLSNWFRIISQLITQTDSKSH